MVKILEVLQSIFGVLAFISFFAIIIIGVFFHNYRYSLLFATILFLALPISLYMNKFTRNKKISLGMYIVIIALIILGFMLLYLTIEDFKTKTVYTINLQEEEGIFKGSFNVPGNLKLSDKKHTFYLEITYVIRSSMSHVEKDLLLKLWGNNLSYSNTISLFHESIDRKSISNSITEIIKSNYKFTPEIGDYYFELSSLTKEMHLTITRAKIIIKEYK